MSNTVPLLTLYPTYIGGPRYVANNAYSDQTSYYTQSNRFVSSYGVNIPASVSEADIQSAYQLEGRFVRGSKGQGAASSGLLPTFDPLQLGGLKSGRVPSTTPTIPDSLQKQMSYLSISDLKFSDLMAQPSFRIDTIGIGLKVTTDGAGGVSKVELSPSSWGLLPRLDATQLASSGLNRAKISRGAIFALTDMSIKTGPLNKAGVPLLPASNAVPLQGVAPNLNTQLNPQTLSKGAGLLAVDNLEAQTLNALLTNNPELEQLLPKLAQSDGLNAPGAGLPGKDLSQGFQPLPAPANEDFQALLVDLINTSKQSPSYAATYGPGMDQVMNGRVPMMPPWVAGAYGTASPSSQPSQATYDLQASVTDTLDKKGKGAMYMPFPNNGFSQAEGQPMQNPFTGSGSGSQSGFGQPGGWQGGFMGGASGGQADQERQRRSRHPLFYSA